MNEPDTSAKPENFFWKLTREHWPIPAAVLPVANAIWEKLGPASKWVLLLIYFAYIVVHYLHLYLWKPDRDKSPVLKGGISVLLAVTIMTGTLTLWHCVALVINYSDQEKRFWHRTDHILQRNYNLYNSTYMPEQFYIYLKDLMNRQYCPRLVDPGRYYTKMKATMYHLEYKNMGILEQTFRGACHSNADTLVFFTNQAESNLYDYGKRIAAISLPDSNSLRPTVVSLSDWGEDYWGEDLACLSFFKLPIDTFHYCRSFCAPGAMTDEIEGFVLDYGNIIHPANNIEISIVTDKRIRDLGVYRMRRERGFLDWLMGKPMYKEERVLSPAEVHDRDVLANFRDLIVSGERCPKQLGAIRVWKDSLLCHGNYNAFVVRYRVESS